MIASLAAAVRGTGVHAVMGWGGAPEGVITAAALKCLGGELQGRFMPETDEQRERLRGMGLDETRCTRPQTSRRESNWCSPQLVSRMGHASRVVRFIDAVHLEEHGARVIVRA